MIAFGFLYQRETNMDKKVLILVNHDIVIFNFRKEVVYKLLESGFDVYLSCPKSPNIEKLIQRGVIHVETKINRHSINPFTDIKLLISYIKIMKKIRPDIVLTYTIKPNIYGGIASQILNYTFIPSITGLGNGFNKNVLFENLSKILYKIALKKAKVIMFQNNENLQYMLKSRIIKNDYVLTAGSGVNLNDFQLFDYPKDDVIKFIYIGRIMKSKGIELYLEAAEHYKNIFNNVEFHIIGDYDGNYENIIKDYQSRKIVTYHGKVENVKEYLHVSHAVINPSFHEGMSNVLLEGAAVGRPGIASDISGCREIVIDNITGYTFKSKDIISLIEVIDKFIKMTFDEKVRMGLNARRLVEEKFNRDNVVEQYMRIIEKTLEDRK